MDDITPKPPPPARARLVQQDILLSREARDGTTRVVARVECARRDCVVEVEYCARCPHFARIETHEAGYLMLCRAADQDEHDAEQPDESKD